MRSKKYATLVNAHSFCHRALRSKLVYLLHLVFRSRILFAQLLCMLCFIVIAIYLVSVIESKFDHIFPSITAKFVVLLERFSNDCRKTETLNSSGVASATTLIRKMVY